MMFQVLRNSETLEFLPVPKLRAQAIDFLVVGSMHHLHPPIHSRSHQYRDKGMLNKAHAQ